MSETALRARAVEKRFGATVALRGVDLEVAAGSIHAILGPNGAGKTTLLRILAGLSQPSAGKVEIEVDGKATRPRHARGALGFVGHATLVYPELSARENLLFAARLYGVRDAPARAARLLEEEGLADVADLRAGAFSRGMAQRLSIARARIHDPKIVLLDEPFTGLDRRSAERLARHLEGLRAEGRALVLITHDVAMAAKLAERVEILVRGRIADHVAGSDIAIERLEAGLLDPSPAGGAPA